MVKWRGPHQSPVLNQTIAILMYCAQEFHDSDSIIESPNFFQRQFHRYRMFINVKRLSNVQANPGYRGWSPPPPPQKKKKNFFFPKKIPPNPLFLKGKPFSKWEGKPKKKWSPPPPPNKSNEKLVYVKIN